MFWKRKKEEQKTQLELPALVELEKWVNILITSLQLEEGSFTILPAFGGILLFIREEGISWIPYNEIRDAMGKLDKLKLAETSSLLGGVAVVAATGGSFLPILLVQGMLKGSYRTIAKPPPIISRTFLKSMIDEVVIEERKIPIKLLKTFEQDPYKKGEQLEKKSTTYLLSISRKFLDLQKKHSKTVKVIEGIKSFFIRSIEPEFLIPPQSDIKQFAKILETNNISVIWKQSEKIVEYEEIEQVNESQQ